MENRFNTFTNIISSIYRSIYVIKDEEMIKYGLKSNHVSCLYNIYNYKSLTQVELIDICKENKAAISRTLSYLIDNDYVIESGDGKYKKHYSLTNKGNEIALIINEEINRLLKEASSSLSNNELNDMYKSLITIDKNLKDIINK